jgi:hypothetical protein
MRKHYKINDKLLNKARTFVINNKPKFEQLYPAEENALLLKFNEELRNSTSVLSIDISKESSLSVVKSSIFFLTRWSNNLRHAISKKIEHICFNPNDLLYQPSLK